MFIKKEKNKNCTRKYNYGENMRQRNVAELKVKEKRKWFAVNKK